MVATPSSYPSGRDRSRALAFLCFTEAWERFSYYGMGAILVLYMSQMLFLPANAGHVAGLAALRSLLQHAGGAATPLALASQVYGLYAGFVYFTPVLGGLIADRLIGRKPAVVIGALLLSAGHFAMAFERSFLAALLLIIIGCGLLKGNISAQVGALYPRDDEAGRTRGFAIFSTGINSGAILGPVAVALIADRFGWHWGFGLAGTLMLVGLATYLAGYRYLPPDPPRPSAVAASGKRPATGDRRLVFALIALMAITVFQSTAYLQNGNIGLVWISGHVDRDLFGFSVPVGWFNALDPLASVVFVPLLLGWWKRSGASEAMRMAQGAAIAALANLVLVVASRQAGPVSVWWPAAYELLLGIGFLFYWPTLLGLVSRAAPARINSTMLGCAFLSLFVAGLLIGVIGSSYERIGPTWFWLANAGLAATGSLLALLAGRPLSRVIAANR